MSTDANNLSVTLARLRTELAAPNALDERSRTMLREMADDIERLLRQPEEATAEHVEGVRSRMREAVERFEASHPGLTANLSMAIDALSRMGI